MTRFTAFLIAGVRWWTRLYTWGLPSALRDARCEQIESDLWESSHDPDVTPPQLVIQIVMRLTLGVPDDIEWRVAQVSIDRSAAFRAVTAGAVLSMLLLFASLARLTPDVPHLPAAPVAALHAHGSIPNPPPPPPPPDGTTATQPIFHYGRTSYSVVTQGPPPVAIKQVQPIYPPLAVAAGIEGQVLVRASITNAGQVTEAEVAPAGILGQSAIDAVQRWRFAAADNGTQRSALLTVRVSFERSR